MPFDYPTNFSNGTMVDSMGNLVKYSDYVSSGWFALAFLLLIFIITFVAASSTSSRKAFLSSSFITFIFSVYFMRLGIINITICFGLLIMTIVGLFGSKSEQSSY